jgi:antitoxin component of MazEF toxin-antitoxin module
MVSLKICSILLLVILIAGCADIPAIAGVASSAAPDGAIPAQVAEVVAGTTADSLEVHVSYAQFEQLLINSAERKGKLNVRVTANDQSALIPRYYIGVGQSTGNGNTVTISQAVAEDLDVQVGDMVYLKFE